MGQRLSLLKAYTDHCRSISRLKYDPSVNQTAKSYFMTRVKEEAKAVRDKTGWQSQIRWCKLKVVPANMKIVISCQQTTEKRMEYTL